MINSQFQVKKRWLEGEERWTKKSAGPQELKIVRDCETDILQSGFPGKANEEEKKKKKRRGRLGYTCLAVRDRQAGVYFLTQGGITDRVGYTLTFGQTFCTDSHLLRFCRIKIRLKLEDLASRSFSNHKKMLFIKYSFFFYYYRVLLPCGHSKSLSF